MASMGLAIRRLGFRAVWSVLTDCKHAFIDVASFIAEEMHKEEVLVPPSERRRLYYIVAAADALKAKLIL